MKKYTLFGLGLLAATLPLLPANQAHALSCLPVADYLKDVVGKEEIVIFEGTSLDRIEEEEYTVEVVRVNDVKQGYVEKEIFVYHQKDPNWGYLCNNGPKAEGSTGVYVAERDTTGKYNVYQRLERTDANVTTLEKNLEQAEVEGEITETTKTDRMNQIMTTITELFQQIGLLLKEYSYWKAQ